MGRGAALTEKQVWRSWHITSAIFGINHGCATTPLIFATTLLDKDVGYAGSALLYVFTCLGSLFASVPIVATLGQRLGLVLGMSLYCAYVLSFAMASATAMGSTAQWLIFLPGSCLGGLAASLLWTSQGGLIDRHATALLAASEGMDRQQATSGLSACFAVYYLLFEVVCKLASSVALRYEAPPWIIFLVCLGLAGVSAGAGLGLRAVDKGAAAAAAAPASSPLTGKLFKALALWRDPVLWLLAFTNLTFGFAAAFMNGNVNATYTKVQLGREWVGYYATATALTGALASHIFGVLAKRFGTKGPFILIGALSFITIPILVLFAGLDSWGYWLIVPYLLQGCGRGVFESINKGVFADFFAGERAEGAFANVMMQTTMSFAFCFFFSSILTRTGLATVVLVLSTLAFPGYLAARALRGAGAGAPAASAGSEDSSSEATGTSSETENP